MVLRWSIVVAAVIGTLAVAEWFGAWMLPAWNTPHTPIERIEGARSKLNPPRPRARRLVFVVVDGLGFDNAETLETLAPLARDGALRPMTAVYPTYTAPGITSMFTGLSPRESGFRLNGAGFTPTGIDDVLHAALDGGVRVRVRARDYPPFLNLARPPKGADARAGRLRLIEDIFDFAPTVEDAAPFSGSEFTAIHIGEVDDESHLYGARSREARKAALHAGLLLQTLAGALDPERDVLIAASDHGHRAAGGHGGVEDEVTRAFLLAWGHDIKKTARLGPRLLRDVAPTLTMLLGVHTPATNMGTPMTDLLDERDGEIAADLAEPFDQVTRFDCAQLRGRGCDDVDDARAALESGDPKAGEDVMEALSGTLDDERDRAASFDALARLAAGVLVAAALLIAASFRLPGWPRLVTLPLLAWGPYLAVLWSRGYAPSLSGMRPGPAFAVDAIVAGLASLGALGFATFRHRLGPRDALWLAVSTAALLVICLSWAGADPRSPPPPLAAALAFLLSPLAAVATAGATVIVGLYEWRRPLS
jgi:hypothetical protein